MSSIAFDTKRIGVAPDVIATDGCEVRVLCSLPRGGMALFGLAAGAVAKAVAHRTVEEIWVVIRGRGRMWRKSGEREDITEIEAGVSISIPTGMHFQLRSDGEERSKRSRSRCRLAGRWRSLYRLGEMAAHRLTRVAAQKGALR